MTPQQSSPLIGLDEIALRMGLTVGQVKHLRRSRRMAFMVVTGELKSKQEWINEFYEKYKDI